MGRPLLQDCVYRQLLGSRPLEVPLSQDPPGWFYVGKGLLRYKFGDFWTDQYKSIDPPEPTARSANSGSSNPASMNTPPSVRRSRLRASRLSIAVCAGLLGLGVGGGLLKPSIPHELVSWATALKSHVSALLVGPASPTPATSSDAKAQVKADVKVQVQVKARVKAQTDAKARADATTQAQPSHSAPPRSPKATPKPKVAKPPARPARANPKIAVNSLGTVATPGPPMPSESKRHNPVAVQTTGR
jgi:hypothetical protein